MNIIEAPCGTTFLPTKSSPVSHACRCTRAPDSFAIEALVLFPSFTLVHHTIDCPRLSVYTLRYTNVDRFRRISHSSFELPNISMSVLACRPGKCGHTSISRINPSKERSQSSTVMDEEFIIVKIRCYAS